MRIAAAIFVTLLLAGCAAQKPIPEQPAMYINMAEPGAKLDAATAASMISQYRQNNGLGAVAVDPALMAVGGSQSASLAVENISAGYHTMAEAFSGWRDSPPHRENMLKNGVTKMGIAASYAPNTKDKVFWTLILAAN